MLWFLVKQFMIANSYHPQGSALTATSSKTGVAGRPTQHIKTSNGLGPTTAHHHQAQDQWWMPPAVKQVAYCRVHLDAVKVMVWEQSRINYINTPLSEAKWENSGENKVPLTRRQIPEFPSCCMTPWFYASIVDEMWGDGDEGWTNALSSITSGFFANIRITQPKQMAKVSMMSPPVKIGSFSSGCRVELSYSMASNKPSEYEKTTLCCSKNVSVKILY
mgnify:CR=1 FL=1